MCGGGGRSGILRRQPCYNDWDDLSLPLETQREGEREKEILAGVS